MKCFRISWWNNGEEKWKSRIVVAFSVMKAITAFNKKHDLEVLLLNSTGEVKIERAEDGDDIIIAKEDTE